MFSAVRAEEFHAPGPSDFWQPLIGDGAFAITRSAILYAVSAIILALVLIRASGRLKLVPSKGQFMVESVYDLVRNSLARDIIGAHDFIKFVPLLFSLFVVIFVNNLFGVVPFIQFPTMSRLGFPVALMIFVYVTYHAVGINRKGLGGWFKSFLPPGLPGWVVPLVYLLELLTYLVIRPATLALRLFGNMFAGHLLLLVFTFGGEYLLLHSTTPNKAAGALSLLFTLVMSAFELIIQFLQAYIFTLLAAVYIAGAVADEH